MNSDHPRTPDVTSRVEAFGTAAVGPPLAKGTCARISLLLGLAGITPLVICIA